MLNNFLPISSIIVCAALCTSASRSECNCSQLEGEIANLRKDVEQLKRVQQSHTSHISNSVHEERQSRRSNNLCLQHEESIQEIKNTMIALMSSQTTTTTTGPSSTTPAMASGLTNLDCPEDEFQCDDGLCIKKDKRCNGVQDCHDTSDEDNCRLPCDIVTRVFKEWPGGYEMQLHIPIKETTSQWNITVNFSKRILDLKAWNTISSTGNKKTYHLVNTDYNGILHAGTPFHDVGFVVRYPPIGKTPPYITSITFNGVQMCQ